MWRGPLKVGVGSRGLLFPEGALHLRLNGCSVTLCCMGSNITPTTKAADLPFHKVHEPTTSIYITNQQLNVEYIFYKPR